MVAIMVALTFGTLILVNIFAVKRLVAKQAQQLAKAQGETVISTVLEEAKNLLFHHGHTWVKLLRAVVAVGLDDFTKRLVGPISQIDVPSAGTKVQKGQKLWSVKFGDRSFTQVAPVSGTILEVNDRLLKDPTNLSKDPKENWVVKIVPNSFTNEVLELQTPSQMQRWTDFQKAKFLREGIPNLALVYGDGGEIVDGVASQIDKEAWEELANKLFS